MPTDLRSITDFDGLLAYLGSELDWPVEEYTREELTFEYDADELGLKDEEVAKLSNGTIQQLRPLQGQQPFGIFFVEFDHAKLPIVVLRRILSQLVIKKRSSANSAEAKRWDVSDLIFISAFGEEEHREIAFAHFHSDPETTDLPVLRVLGWHGDDTQLKSAAVAKTLKNLLSWPEDDGDQEAWRQQWRSAFRHKPGHTISTSKELATAMAGFARRIRDAARAILPYESENGRLRKLYKGFQDALIHDLSEEDFTTYYAETICYGLFTVAVSKTELSEGKYGTAMSADDVAHFVPVTNPFLKEMLWSFLEAGGRNQELNFDDLGINEIVSFFNSSETDLPLVIQDFGSKRPGEDPVIHLYEDFLKQFDAELRKKRGVYYTPKPVVSYIVRSVHELLQTEFGLADGLADTSTWGEMLGKHAGLELPTTFDDKNREHPISEDEPFVQILDPATGTATFLVEVIEVIHKHLVAKWKQQGLTGAQQLSAWNDYVPQHLLPRLHGYELMMAPYAIAHMKIGLKLAETGYHFATEERARIFLTNALEAWAQQLPLIGFDALAQEAAAVNEIKRHKRFTVVIGNPPYSALSANLSTANRRLVDRYRSVNGERIRERSMLQFEKNIQDDYIKFFAIGQSLIESSAIGILGYVTNHSYLDGPTLRGMRNNLLLNFSALRLLDLHGNSNKKENKENGDENVFDIQQGVAVTLLTKRPEPTSRECSIGHMRGTRASKFNLLDRTSCTTTASRAFVPDKENYYFIAFESNSRSEYQEFLPLTSLLRKNLTGTTTGFDNLLLDFDKDVLESKLERFADSRVTDSALSDEFEASKGHSAKVLANRQSITHGEWNRLVKPFQLFPFDYRWGFLKQSLLQGHRFDVMQNLAPKKPGLLAMRQSKEEFGVFAVNGFCGHKLLASYDRNYAFPLYDLSFEDLTFLESKPILNALGKKKGDDIPSPDEIFYYAYAVFHSPGYRSRYAEFLKIDFPRLPLTGILELFRALARLGGELTALHLLESSALDEPITEFIGKSRQVSKVGWTSDEGGTVWLDGRGSGENYQSGTSGFQGVPEEVWNFHIGGYQVCEKWLKDRGPKKGQPGRTLTDDDIAHYHKIVIALTETIRLMAEIDEVIETHGGWPGAFAASGK